MQLFASSKFNNIRNSYIILLSIIWTGTYLLIKKKVTADRSMKFKQYDEKQNWRI